MKSIKPGRFNSAQGVLVSLFGVLFSIFWTVMAFKSNAPFFFPIFGCFFIIMSLMQLYKNIHNTTSKDRYSEYDIVDSKEERDPWDDRVLKKSNQLYIEEKTDILYCPYCGTKLESSFDFCPKCGKKLPF